MKPTVALLLAIATSCQTLHAAPDKPAEEKTVAKPLSNPLFTAYDGDHTIPAKMDFQIIITGVQPSFFLRLGDSIPGTPWTLDRFTFKERRNAKTGELNNVSELCLIDKKTGKSTVLIVAQPTDSPGGNSPDERQPKRSADGK